MLVVAMMRVERSQRLRGNPSKYGRAAWQPDSVEKPADAITWN
jgi:hypothetical protein